MKHMKHMKHMKFGRGIFLTPSTDAFTPSTACGRSPSLEEGGLGAAPVKASGLAVDCI